MPAYRCARVSTPEQTQVPPVQQEAGGAAGFEPRVTGSAAAHTPETPPRKASAISTAQRIKISDDVARFRDQTSRQALVEVMQVFDADQRGLDAAGVPTTVLRPPAPFPAADLLDIDGNTIGSRDVLAGRPAVVVFYRGAWCPYCNIALRAYQRLLPELTARETNLVAVSPQKPDGSLSAQQANELTFTLLSDPGCRLAEALGVITTTSDDVLTAQSTLGLDLRSVNTEGTVAVPMPTVALVDATGVLRWIDVHPDYTTRTEPDQILAALDANLMAPGPTATAVGLESVGPRLESLAEKLGVKSVLVMRSDHHDMVVAATAGPATVHYGVGDSGPKAGGDATQVPLYCERVVDSGQSTFVRDSREDQTFAGNADETEFGLVNYFGVPIRDRDGRVVGTVCVLDDHARDYDDEARSELAQLRNDVEFIVRRDGSALDT